MKYRQIFHDKWIVSSSTTGIIERLKIPFQLLNMFLKTNYSCKSMSLVYTTGKSGRWLFQSSIFMRSVTNGTSVTVTVIEHLQMLMFRSRCGLFNRKDGSVSWTVSFVQLYRELYIFSWISLKEMSTTWWQRWRSFVSR